MNQGRTIFAQLMDRLPLAEFRLCVERYVCDHKVQRFSRLDQFRVRAGNGAPARARLGSASCGGGGSSPVVHTPGTPAGSYLLTVRAIYTSGSTNLTHPVTLNLTVQ